MRRIFFWIHLTMGSIAGAVILLMSVTGVLLMYERQMVAWADRGFQSIQGAGGGRLAVDTLIENVRQAEGAAPATLTVHADPKAAAEASYGREKTVFVDVYTGAVLGEGSRHVRQFFRVVTDWHRWLGRQGESRATSRTVTGASNLVFLFLVLSGMYLWLPRKWSWPNVRAVLLFRGGLSGKALDFNWHNVVGIWSAIPLFFIVLGGVMISFPWATNLLYKATGTAPPTAPARQQPSAGSGGATKINGALTKVAEASPGWRTISVRVPAGNGPLTFTVDRAHRGRPDLRTSVVIDAATGEVQRTEKFETLPLGRRLRTWLRWIHTGEAGGVAGQTIAGLASAGGAVLTWTGISLALRRLRASRARARARAEQLAGV